MSRPILRERPAIDAKGWFYFMSEIQISPFDQRQIIRWKHGARRADMLIAAALWELGLSVREIAESFGVRKPIISGIVHRNRELFQPRPSPIVRGRGRG